MNCTSSDYKHPLIPLILFEDDDILVLNKPGGMLALDDDTGRPSLIGLAKSYLKEQSSCDGIPYCAAMHRIDRPVSGVMLFAKNRAAASMLSAEMKGRRIRKFYCAVVNTPAGTMREGEWDLLRQFYVIRRGRAHIVDENEPAAVPVAIRYRLMRADGSCGLVLVELVTGKRHQIRVQLSSMGMPISGDKTYGDRTASGYEIISLHAHFLSFTHPVTGSGMTVSAPLPHYMAEAAGCVPGIEDYKKD